MHPWSACKKKHAAEPQVQADQPAFPAQWFYGLYVISPVTGLSCHRRRRDAKHHRQVDASVGAPGPYDFAVRDIVVRLLTRRVHRIPLPTFVTIAKRPSCECGMTWMIVLIWGLRQCPSGCGTLARRANRHREPLSVIPGRCASKSAVADLDNYICRTRVNPRSGIEPGISRFPDAQLRIRGPVLAHHPGMTSRFNGCYTDCGGQALPRQPFRHELLRIGTRVGIAANMAVLGR